MSTIDVRPHWTSEVANSRDPVMLLRHRGKGPRDELEVVEENRAPLITDIGHGQLHIVEQPPPHFLAHWWIVAAEEAIENLLLLETPSAVGTGEGEMVFLAPLSEGVL